VKAVPTKQKELTKNQFTSAWPVWKPSVTRPRASELLRQRWHGGEVTTASKRVDRLSGFHILW